MTTFPGSPRLQSGGFVLIHPHSGAVQSQIALQYNPATLSRSLQVQGVGNETGDRSEALRIKGPPIETINIEAEIDAADQLELAEQNTLEYGIQPHLSALETLVYPPRSQLENMNRLAQQGTLEIIAEEAPLTLFIWSKSRVVPVRLTEFSITEEAFDPSLNPLRARVNLGMRVLTIDDLGFENRGGRVFMEYQRNKESLSARFRKGSLSNFGINRIPG
ncbi:MAG: hypothetical protein AAGF83_11990 [Cyanobacteria bacterium P01_G01_bin.67]